MSQAYDKWYVRLPDGRVLRAASTHVLRQHLSAGRIPWDSRVRRSSEEEWTALEWTEEFADLAQHAAEAVKEGNRGQQRGEPAWGRSGLISSRLAPRYDPTRLQTIGFHGLAEELLAALDNTLARPKLIVAGIAGVLSGTIVAIGFMLGASLEPPWSWALLGVLGLAVLVVMVVSNVVLTQMTYTELSRLRPATWAEARAGWLPYSLRVLVAFAIAAGGTIGVILLLRWLPEQWPVWTEDDRYNNIREVGAQVIAVVGLLLEVILWAVLGFTLLLAPVVVIEETSLLGALGQWWYLVRRHLGRLFLYESAAVLGGVAMLAFAFPLALAAWPRQEQLARFDSATGVSFCILAGLAAAPLIAYLAVAHVFIYLNVRYEYDNRK
jgi:hypothetical protein